MDDYNFAPCGLNCKLCNEANNGCTGCRNGGGNKNCLQLICCQEKKINGCWQCHEFPCNKGGFENMEKRGIMIAFATSIKQFGHETSYEIISRELGSTINYQEFNFISEQNISNLLNRTNK